MRGNLSDNRSNSQHLLNENDIKKLFPFTQQYHNRYLQQNRLQNIKDELSNQQQQSIAFQIKDLLIKDKTKSRINLDELTMQTSPRMRTKERTISVNRKSNQPINYHDSQNINLHNKSVRRDLVQLAQWLDVMVKQVQQSQSQMPFQEYFYKIEVIFSGSVLELQRLLQQKNYESGQFLRKIWDLFIMNVQYVIEGLSGKANQVEQESLDEINKLHEWYQEAMSKQVSSIQSLKEEINNLTMANSQLHRENQYLRRKDGRREKHLKELIFDKDHYSLEIIEMKSQRDLLSKPIFGEQQQYQNQIFDYFKKQCENHMKTMEQHYKNLQLQDQYCDQALDILIKDKSCQVVDLIKYMDSSTSTMSGQLITVATQTHKQKRQQDQEIQVKVDTNTQETQVAIYQIKRDKLIRNTYEQQIFKHSTLHLEDIIDQYSDFLFPLKQLSSNDPIYLELISDEIDKQSKNLTELLDIINIRNDIAPKDFVNFKQYTLKQQEDHKKNYTTIWNIIMNQQAQILDKLIEKQDLQVELDEIKDTFKTNMAIIKEFQMKVGEEQKISSFYETSLVRIIRYAPQFIINQIQEEAQRLHVLQGVEFKEMRKKTTITDSRISATPQNLSVHQTFSPIRGSQISQLSPVQITSQKQIGVMRLLKAQKSFEIEVDVPRELRDLDEDSQQSDSSQEEENPENIENLMSMLKIDLAPQQPELTLEKRLRINTCPMKSALYATQILKQTTKKFKRNNMKGLYTLNTLIQYYGEFVSRQLPYNQNTPLHVHLYEFIVQKFGQSVESNRYKRIIKSFLYYEHRHSTCKIVVKFLKGYFDVQDFNNYLEIMELCKSYPNVVFYNFIQVIKVWLSSNHYSENEIDTILNDLNQSDLSYLRGNSSPTEYDLVIDYFFILFEKYKNRTSSKYKHLFEAIDVSQTGTINFQQWNCIYETIIQSNYLFSFKLFQQEADYHNKERLMSRQRFTVVSDELQIFQNDQQQKFLDYQTFDDLFLEIQNKWYQTKITMKICYIKANRYDKLIKSLFSNIDKNLENKQSIESTCYAYKLLQKTSKSYFLESQLPNYICSFYLDIVQSYRNFEEEKLNK